MCLILIALLLNCSKENLSENPIVIPPEPEKDLVEFTILYTNDEHGWIEGSHKTNSAANMMGLWHSEEGYYGDDSYLILSGGDNWLGPPISNNFMGESVVDVMNAMEYDASAIGNHEFEFGVPNLYNRVEQANFPYLSANIRKKGTNEIPSFTTPFIIKSVNDIMIGIIGLTPIGTENLTVTEYVEDYEFIDYTKALEEIVPLVKEDGADLIILIAHVCYSTIINMAQTLTELGIFIAGTGHCHYRTVTEIVNTDFGDLAVFQSSEWFGDYIRATITFDKVSKKVTKYDLYGHYNELTEVDTSVENVIKHWKNKLISQTQN